jgi:hypothetical protein
MQRFVLTLLVLSSLWVIAPVHAVEIFQTACAGITPQNLAPSSECQQVMSAFPDPVVAPIRQDGYTLSNYSFWKVSAESPLLFDGPGGNAIGQMPPGFNFVHAVDAADGWIRNRSGQWMSTNDLEFRETSRFRGVRLLNGLQNPFGWVLGDLVTVPYPGAKQDMETGEVKFRYNLVNIFAEVRHTDGWLWYMVGPDQWIEQRSLAVAKPVERPEDVEARRWVGVDLYEQTLVAYEGTTPVFATLIASGLPGWDTNEGVFDIWAWVERDGMSGATGAPDAYALESVPWVMYFDDAISLHGTYWHDGFGYRRSHGCVNLSISDASFVFDWTGDQEPDAEGKVLSQVYVYASGEYRGRGPATK